MPSATSVKPDFAHVQCDAIVELRLHIGVCDECLNRARVSRRLRPILAMKDDLSTRGRRHHHVITKDRVCMFPKGTQRRR